MGTQKNSLMETILLSTHIGFGSIIRDIVGKRAVLFLTPPLIPFPYRQNWKEKIVGQVWKNLIVDNGNYSSSNNVF